MKHMTHDEIRNKWLSFFEKHGHSILASAPVVPYNDDSLLFINAGMTPLKKYFDGSVIPENKRLASIQKCIRTNDIENVGVTARHLTFFEMMGNFSIGDYFKNEAILFSFEFLTNKDYMGIPKEKLYVTIYPTDIEAKNKWIEVGLDADHIIPLENNFWEIGEGPCGPDTEIFYDLGEEFGGDEAFKAFVKDEDQDRFVEIWNNVFSQYNSEENNDRSEYKELPHKNIDTGAGLERWAMIFQNKKSIFETDLFMPIIEKLEEISGKKYDGSKSFKVIADHIRTITFGLADGTNFANTGRGYVLRRLLRRSVRFGKKIGIEKPFMYNLVDVVRDLMIKSYPYLETEIAKVKALVLDEENLFHQTLNIGERKLHDLIKVAHNNNNFISGKEIFKLYDTYGFPYELSLEYLEEADCTTSKEEFNDYMQKQIELSKQSSSKKSMAKQNKALMDFTADSQFTYDEVELTTKVIGLFKGDERVNELSGRGLIVLEKTPFYAESGGQIYDTGAMKNEAVKIIVNEVFKGPNGQHIHEVEVIEGVISEGDILEVKIKESERDATRKNHSSIHVIQKTLREMVSQDIKQAGSYVDHEKFRFDFTYVGSFSDEIIIQVEEAANKRLALDKETKIEYMSLSEAINKGALAFFNEKYGQVVRVVTIGDTMELCGGTHVRNIKDIEKIAILSVESIGSNIYRLEGTTAENIKILVPKAVAKYVKLIQNEMDKAKNILDNAKAKNIDLKFEVFLDEVKLDSYKAIKSYKNMLRYVQDEVRELDKNYHYELLKLNEKEAQKFNQDLKIFNNINYLLLDFNDKDTKEIRAFADEIKKDKEVVIIVNNIKDNEVNLIISSSCKINASDLLKKLLIKLNGKGGGSNTFASGLIDKKIDEATLLEAFNE